MEVPFVWRLPVDWMVAGGLAYPGQARGYRSRAPGAIAEQGIGSVNYEDFSIAPTQGQAEVNAIVGHLFAEAASPVESLPLPLKLMLDIFEPCDDDVYLWKVPETYALYAYLLRYLAAGNLAGSTVLESGLRSVLIRLRPLRVTRQWHYSRGGVTETLVVDGQPETYGQDAITEPIATGGAAPQQPTSGILPGEVFQPAFPLPLASQQAYGLGWVDVGGSIKFGYTRELGRSFPHWVDLTSLMSGAVVSADWDSSSPYITSGYTTGALRAYVLTFAAGSYRIYRVGDLRSAAPSADLQASFSTANTRGFGQIRSSQTTADFALCALIERVGGTP